MEAIVNPARDGRFGDALHELPRQCLTGMPELAGDPYGHAPCGQYEGLIIDLLGRGNRVPDHPSACQAQADASCAVMPGCGIGIAPGRIPARSRAAGAWSS